MIKEQASNVKKHYRVCNLCEAMCGLEIEYKDTEIISIKGDKKDPFSKGSICPKGAVIGDLYNDPNRLKKPLKKTTSGFVEIEWEEAYAIVGEKINQTRSKYGNNAIGLYLGNPTVHNYGSMMFIGAFKKALRTQNTYSPTSMDQLPHHFAAYFMFGSAMLMPIPDIDRTQYMIIMGANPIASNGSIMSAAGIQNRLKNIQKRGGKYIVIDPRKTETAKTADDHFYIKPGTDVYLLLAILHTILKEKKYNLRHLENHILGFEELMTIANPFSLDKVASITGIASSIIKDIISDFVEAKNAVIYGRMGVSTQSYGGLCHWLINTINIISGNFDREGGAMFTKPAVPIIRTKKGHNAYGRWKSRVRNLPEFEGELPVSVLAEEILTKGKGQIKALITNAGNPVLSSPNSEKLDKALKTLDFMVSIDIYLNETTRHADIILPPTNGLEIDHYDLIFNTFSVSNNAKFSKALFRPKEYQRHDWEILKALTKRFSKKKLSLFYRFSTPKRLLQIALLFGPYGNLGSFQRLFTGLNLRKIKKSVHGVHLGPLIPMLPQSLKTVNQKINLAPSLFINEMKELIAAFENQQMINEPNEFYLIGRRHLRSNNSWMHNNEKLMTGKNRCTAMINETDAKRLHLKEGDHVMVSSKVGKINIPLELNDHIMPGVISIPHGYGHIKKGTKLEIAEKKPGSNVNIITDDSILDKLTGNAAFSGQIVQIEKEH